MPRILTVPVRRYKSFVAAKKFARALSLKAMKEWNEYVRSSRLPMDIPRATWHIYEKTWKGIEDWIGTGNIASSNREFRPFDKARYVRSLQLKDYKELEIQG